MRILIIDDTTANIEAAKLAAIQFPDHEFVFTQSANDGFNKLSEVDAVVTDLFFKGESPVGELQAANDAYANTLTHSDLLNQAPVNEYLDSGIQLDGTLELLKTGMPLEYIKKRFANDNKLDYLLSIDQEFPLGGTIMVKAKELGKKLCLLSNIHRHAGNYADMAACSVAMILLIPVMHADIATPDQVLYDGADCLTYIGGDEIRKYDEKVDGPWNRTGKTDPKVWAEAIRRVLAQ